MHTCFVLILLLTAFPVLSSCNTRSPNLLESQLMELASVVVFPDSSHVPPDGARHREIRAVDRANPPAVIDIAGNINNRRAFKLSDFASSAKYIHLQQPPDVKITVIRNIVSDDERIFINAREGLFCFSAEGQYLYTIVENEVETVNLGVSGAHRTIKGVHNEVYLLNGILSFRTFHWPTVGQPFTDFQLNVFDVEKLSAQMLFNTRTGEMNVVPQPMYQRKLPPDIDSGALSRYLLLDNQSLFINSSLTSIALNGDTLCKFNDYNHPELRPDAINIVALPPRIYRIGGNVMLRIVHNDTVFRIVPPNRLTPTYVLNWGNYRPDMNQWFAGSSLEGKLVLGDWIETQRFIFIRYTEGRDFPRRRDAGQVKDHWAVYDKTAKTLTHHVTSAERRLMFENDVDLVGMPFYPAGLNHRDEMYMTFGKVLVRNLIAAGIHQNDKLQAIYNNMPDDGICLMIVK